MEEVLSARMFGGFEICRRGRTLAGFKYEKVRALAAYLLLEPPEPHDRDMLAGLLWPEQSEAKARHSLRQALSTLRNAMPDGKRGPPLLLSSRTTIQRNADAAVATDAADFEDCLRGAADHTLDLARLGRATRLYRGELLHGLSLARTVTHLGRYAEARRLGEQTLHDAAGDMPPPQRGLLLSVVGAARPGDGNSHRARHELTDAVGAFGTGWQVDWRARRSIIQTTLACSLCHLENLDGARIRLAEALRTGIEVRSLIAVMNVLPALALFSLKQRQTARALEHYAFAQTLPFVTNSRWFGRIVGEPIAKVPPSPAGNRGVRVCWPDQLSDVWRLARSWEAHLH